MEFFKYGIVIIYLHLNLFFLRINSIKTQPMKMHKNQTRSCNVITKPIRYRWPVYATDSTSGKGEGKGEGEVNTGIKIISLDIVSYLCLQINNQYFVLL